MDKEDKEEKEYNEEHDYICRGGHMINFTKIVRATQIKKEIKEFEEENPFPRGTISQYDWWVECIVFIIKRKKVNE